MRPYNIIRPEAWHAVEYINAISPKGQKFRLGYHFYDSHMRIWMFGGTYHTREELITAGWALVFPERVRK